MIGADARAARPVLLYVPSAAPSQLNLREHWSARHRRVRAQRDAVRCEWLRLGRPVLPYPATVTLTRVAPRKLDGDNLVAALKPYRDEVAALMGIDDADPGVNWTCAQEARRRNGRSIVAVAIDVAPRSGAGEGDDR